MAAATHPLHDDTQLLPHVLCPPGELIDGDKLCDLLQQYDLGVRTTQRVVEDVDIVAEFFHDSPERGGNRDDGLKRLEFGGTSQPLRGRVG